jgi:pseudouridine-5'-phosphate glycosidase
MSFTAYLGIQIVVIVCIRGVHQNGDSTMDVSFDLIKIGRTPVVTICVDEKSILNFPLSESR